MPELPVKEIRLPELHLPEISREEILRTVSEVHRPDLDLPSFDRPKIEVPEVAIPAWARSGCRRSTCESSTSPTSSPRRSQRSASSGRARSRFRRFRWGIVAGRSSRRAAVALIVSRRQAARRGSRVSRLASMHFVDERPTTRARVGRRRGDHHRADRGNDRARAVGRHRRDERHDSRRHLADRRRRSSDEPPESAAWPMRPRSPTPSASPNERPRRWSSRLRRTSEGSNGQQRPGARRRRCRSSTSRRPVDRQR